MRRNKLLAIGLLVVAFVLFFVMRPVREKACPLSNKLAGDDPELKAKCDALGGVIKDGECTCPD